MIPGAWLPKPLVATDDEELESDKEWSCVFVVKLYPYNHFINLSLFMLVDLEGGGWRGKDEVFLQEGSAIDWRCCVFHPFLNL